MLDEFDKCRFCKWYDDYEGCDNGFCCPAEHDDFKIDIGRVVEKAKEMNMSVTDVVTLINQVS